MVEHPLSKRKVGSSILPGGKLLAPQIDKRTTKRTSRSFVACGLYTVLNCRIDERLDTPVGLDASFALLLSQLCHHGPVSGSLTASEIASQPGLLFPSSQRGSTRLVALCTPAEFHRPGCKFALAFFVCLFVLVGASGLRAVCGRRLRSAGRLGKEDELDQLTLVIESLSRIVSPCSAAGWLTTFGRPGCVDHVSVFARCESV